MPNMEDALSYLDLNYSIIPCKPDKRPYCQWIKFQTSRPAREEVVEWWKKWPQANIAAITGQISGVVAIDIDSAIGMEAYKAQFGEVHNTISQTTGKPGARHLLFRPPAGVVLANSNRGLPDVDVRGDGGYIIVAPSIHLSGRKYSWLIDPRESPDDLMDLPEDVKSWFWPGVKESAGDKKERLDVQNLLLGVQKGRRNDICARLAGYYLRITKGDTEQTRAVLELWNQRNDPPLDWKEISRTVDSISKKQGREEVGEKTGAFIRELEKHVYPDGTYKYVVYPQERKGFFSVTSKDLADQNGFILRYMEAMDYKLPRIKGKDWDALLNKLLSEVKVVEISDDETEIGVIKDTILAEIKRPISEMEALSQNKIVINETKIYFRTKALLDRVKYQGEKFDQKKLGQLLRRMGGENGSKRVGENWIWCWEIDKGTL
jgi:hypothetical protein